MTLARIVRMSSTPANSDSSSNHKKPKYPRDSAMDFDFAGSSAPRKRIFCPVGL